MGISMAVERGVDATGVSPWSLLTEGLSIQKHGIYIYESHPGHKGPERVLYTL